MGRQCESRRCTRCGADLELALTKGHRRPSNGSQMWSRRLRKYEVGRSGELASILNRIENGSADGAKIRMLGEDLRIVILKDDPENWVSSNRTRSLRPADGSAAALETSRNISSLDVSSPQGEWALVGRSSERTRWRDVRVGSCLSLIHI